MLKQTKKKYKTENLEYAKQNFQQKIKNLCAFVKIFNLLIFN